MDFVHYFSPVDRVGGKGRRAEVSKFLPSPGCVSELWEYELYGGENSCVGFSRDAHLSEGSA
eukprot:scaffold33970_cov107-Isochrysis_galbana.AAC.1